MTSQLDWNYTWMNNLIEYPCSHSLDLLAFIGC